VRWSVLALSGQSRHCKNLSALGQERTLSNRCSPISIYEFTAKYGGDSLRQQMEITP